MTEENQQFVPASQVVIALADMASQGRYDNVTIEGARQMNQLYELVAKLINSMEEEEANQLEQAQQEATADADDKENEIE